MGLALASGLGLGVGLALDSGLGLGVGVASKEGVGDGPASRTGGAEGIRPEVSGVSTTP
jgi:hypothetical protein